MNPTNKLAHFKNGSNSVLGLPVFTDEAGAEFVLHESQWVHVSEVPLEHSHTVEASEAKPKRIPQLKVTPVAPDVAAFQSPKAHTPGPRPMFTLDESGNLIPQD